MNWQYWLLIALVVIVLIWLVSRAQSETFLNIATTSLPLGYPRFGLRGDLLRTEPIEEKYIRRYPHVRLHPSNNEMYESNVAPGDEGVLNCSKSSCPHTNDGYYEGDHCWMCGFSHEPKHNHRVLWPY